MKIKCLSNCLGPEQKKEYGNRYTLQYPYRITIDKEYLVLGISSYYETEPYGTGIYVDVMNDMNYLDSIPILLCKVTDNRISQYWEFRQDAQGSAFMRPVSFYLPDYFVKFAEGDSDIVANVTRIYEILDLETNGWLDGPRNTLELR